jgi:hypothetical protein
LANKNTIICEWPKHVGGLPNIIYLYIIASNYSTVAGKYTMNFITAKNMDNF